ncbi:hypothetical protein V5799_009230 [Amblyomma americanum]|uniref:Uncharacterized protein n=1 Tax=Amblyomma americanum TaxID=6943 RepID=A0AAQ4FC53_AMBAM
MKASLKSSKAAHYNKEWLYDCLLKKKSSAVYTFLHENEYLPLPYPRTINDCMRNLNDDFGFDANLFIVLKEKLQAVPDRERRVISGNIVHLKQPAEGWKVFAAERPRSVPLSLFCLAALEGSAGWAPRCAQAYKGAYLVQCVPEDECEACCPGKEDILHPNGYYVKDASSALLKVLVIFFSICTFLT